MSKEKVEKYKKEKAGRKQSLKKEKRKRTIIISLCLAALIVGAGVGGYYFGNRDGYNKGYTDGFSIAGQLYRTAAASSGAITSGSSVTTPASGSAAK